MIRWFPLALGFVVFGACSSGSSSGSGGSGGSTGGTSGSGGGGVPATTPLTYKVCDETKRLGGVTVELKRNPGSTPFTAISGGVKTPIDPTAVSEELAKDGDCRQMVGRMLVCNTPCAAGKVCAGSNMCVDSPTTQ